MREEACAVAASVYGKPRDEKEGKQKRDGASFCGYCETVRGEANVETPLKEKERCRKIKSEMASKERK